MTAKIICFEGIVGAGKTTQMQLLANSISSVVIPELNTYSPLKEAIAEWKRRVVLEGRIYFTEKDVRTLARARAKVQNEILAASQQAEYTLFDRSVYTSAVLEAGDVSPSQIEEINQAEGVIFPTQGFILDCEPKEALRRIDKRRLAEGRYSSRSMHETVEEITKRRNQYLNLSKDRPHLQVLDANQSEEALSNEIKRRLQ